MKLNVIHIFSYGEAQIISDTINHKAKVSEFSKLQAVIDDIKSKKPTEVTLKDFHVINIFCDSKVSYISTEKTSHFYCNYSDLNKTKLNALLTEFQRLKDMIVE